MHSSHAFHMLMSKGLNAVWESSVYGSYGLGASKLSESKPGSFKVEKRAKSFLINNNQVVCGLFVKNTSFIVDYLFWNKLVSEVLYNPFVF